MRVFEQDLPQDFLKGNALAIDTETMGLNLIRDRLALLQISDGSTIALVKFAKNLPYDAPNLCKILSDKGKEKIFHFARFDLAIIKKYLGINLENIFCTKIASILVRTYSSKHSLKELCKELFNVNISKAQQTSYWGSNVLTNEQKDYAANDVRYLHQIKDILQERLVLEKRDIMAKKIFEFVPIRSDLDLLGWNDCDIFSHNIFEQSK
ncbi:MAG: ribonuclease D [Rickettsia sp.]|nr:ribonuclease D [Rickettsia sp.]